MPIILFYEEYNCRKLYNLVTYACVEHSKAFQSLEKQRSAFKFHKKLQCFFDRHAEVVVAMKHKEDKIDFFFNDSHYL